MKEGRKRTKEKSKGWPEGRKEGSHEGRKIIKEGNEGRKK